jgi:tetratricopeptide (TPR) repeat protein
MRWSALPILALVFGARGTLTSQATAATGSNTSQMQQHYDAAYRYQSSRDFVRADIEHKRFLAAALDRLANFYANTGDYLHAVPLYEEALQLTPNDFALLMDYAGASLDAHDPQKTNDLMRAVTRLDISSLTQSQRSDVHLMLGQTLRALGEKNAALEQFRAAIAINPNIDNYGALADAVLESDGSAAAARIFAMIVARFGDSAPVHMRIGRIYAMSGSPDRAIQEFKIAVARDYKMPDVHYSLGAAYLSNLANELPLAEAEFRKEVQLHPNDTFSYPQLGYIALRRLNYREAERDFQRALVANPLDAAVFIDLGKLYVDTARPAQAEDAFRRAIALTIDPSRNDYGIERVHYRLGRLLIARGKESEGERELQIAQEMLSKRDQQEEQQLTGQPIARGPLERTRFAAAKESKQLNLFAKQVRPLIAGSYNNLGVHAAMSEKYVEAAGYFRLAAKWDPTLAEVDRNWSRAAFAAHDCAQALEPLRRAAAADLSNAELRGMLNQCQNVLSKSPDVR